MDIPLIAENVFRLCCDENGDEAPVENVVKFFKNKRDAEQWRLCNKEVDLLYDLLDPQSSHRSVNLSMLEIGLHKWVQYIRYRSSDEELPLDSVDDYSIFDQCNFAKLSEQTHKEAGGAEQPADSGMPLSETRLRSDGHEEFEVSYVSAAHARGDGSEAKALDSAELSSYSDVADILSRLHQTRHENCVLLDDKKKLQLQLEAAEENIQQQQSQLTEWEKKNRSFQSVSRENKELQKEVEELRNSIETLESTNRELHQTQTQTERDVAYWQERAEEYSNMLSRRQQEMDQRNKSIEELKRSLREHKETIEECNIFGRSQLLELENKGLAMQQLNEMVEHLNEKSERLLRQKEEQDSQLHWYKSEMQKLRLSVSGLGEDVKKDQQHNPRKCSTPHRLESLQSELYAGMSQEGLVDLPSPFCEKASSMGQLPQSRSFDFALGASRDSLMSVDELEPKTMLEMEIEFLKLMNSIPLDAELKEKCIEVFRGVLSLHQGQTQKLVGELRQIKEQKSFVQSRYQEALQQLRDTSCILETDIADKMASLEEQIKAEQVQRLEMEAQLSKFRQEEELRLSKSDISTQVKFEAQSSDSTRSSALDGTLRESSLRTDNLSFRPPSLLGALDLASARSSRSLPASESAPSQSDPPESKLRQLLPDFDVEFSYSFDTPLLARRKTECESSEAASTADTRPEDSLISVRSSNQSGGSDEESVTARHDEAPMGNKVRFKLNTAEHRPRRSFRPSRTAEAPSLPNDDAASRSPTVTLSSSSSCHSGQRQADSSLKESDGSEDRENGSVTTTASSVEDLVLPVTGAFPVRQLDLCEEVPMSSSGRICLPGVVEEESGAGTMPTASEDEVFSETDRPSLPPVFPNLPNATLKELDLLSESLDTLSSWSEEEAEQKFVHLSLAFRTDRETLEERIKLHRLGRDNAERNAKHEVDAIRQVVTGLSQIPNLSVEIIGNLQNTCKVLEQSIHRLASNSEILGAVQQEDRLSHAVDVMLHHMNNLRRSQAKDSRELEEARRILKANATEVVGEGLSKRSLSLVGCGSPVKPMRRTSTASRKSTVSTDSHELRSRFQTGLYNSSFQSPLSQHLRRLSTDRYEAGPDLPLRFPSIESNPMLIHETNGRVGKLSNASDITVSSALPEKDAIFQKGLEQGLRAQVGNELGTLREEQASLTESLDYLMEVHSLVEEDLENDDAYDKRDFVDFLIAKVTDFLTSWRYNISFLRARWIAGAAAFAVAILILFWCVLWSVTVQHPASAPS